VDFAVGDKTHKYRGGFAAGGALLGRLMAHTVIMTKGVVAGN
jgi:hypothetical protein